MQHVRKTAAWTIGVVGLIGGAAVTAYALGFFRAGGFDFERMGYDDGRKFWPDISAMQWDAEVTNDATEGQAKARLKAAREAAIKAEAEREECNRKVKESIEASRVQYKKADAEWKECIDFAKYPPDNWQTPQVKCRKLEVLRMAAKAGLASIESGGECPRSLRAPL
jgi:hypothetical protein